METPVKEAEVHLPFEVRLQLRHIHIDERRTVDHVLTPHSMTIQIEPEQIYLVTHAENQ
jgi:hypothetical protein